jgi:amidohydrolase
MFKWTGFLRLGWYFRLVLVSSLLWVPAFAQQSQGSFYKTQKAIQLPIDQAYPFLEKLYRYFHSHPELSFHEMETSTRLARELKTIGFDVSTRMGGYGVVGILKNGEGPTVMIRTDMDALPITEETGLSYASRIRTKNEQDQNVGVMHACGHDVHMTVFVGTAYILMQIRDMWSGTLMMVGQPAEEKGAGAKNLLADGLFTRFPIPDYCLALHVAADLPAGKVGYLSGYAMANVDSVDITLHGVGGHGASPHRTKDPVVMAAQVILSLQSIVSREMNPIDSAVITVGSIHSGTQHNIIPDEAHLQLTVRSFSDKTRRQLLTSIKRVVKGIAAAAGAPVPTFKIREDPTPSLYNDPILTERLVRTFETVLGKANVVSRDPEMIGEDFARYGRTKENIPICMFRLGTVGKKQWAEMSLDGKQPPSLHSSMFSPSPEATIKTGVTAMASAALELLEAGPPKENGRR